MRGIPRFASILLRADDTGRALRRVVFSTAVGLFLFGGALMFLPKETRLGESGLFSISAAALVVLGGLTVLIPSGLILGARLLKTDLLRRKAEHRSAMCEINFRATFEQNAVGIAHVAVTGRFIRTNARLSSMLGYTREEFSRLNFQDISYAEDLRKDLDYFQRVLDGDLTEYTTEKRYLKKDGNMIWANLTVALLRTPQGRPKYFISVVEDISVWKHTQEALEAASKAKDQFISVISHELRTPLTPVLAALSGDAEKNGGLNDPATIEMMRRNIEHEASIINDLLDLNRISSSGKLKLELRPVDLHSLIKEVFRGTGSALQQKGLTCHLSLEATRHVVNGDPIRLRQILLNLLDNAMKFTPRGGRIAVETLPGPKPDSIVVRVVDSGIGIEPENLGRIFDAFEQARKTSSRSYGGLGLGLAIVRGLVEAHGGSIRAQSSAPAKPGAAFEFNLHLTDKPAAVPETHRVQGAKHFRILLVEDHIDTRLTLTRLLKRRGHTVEAATGVQEAVRLKDETFDLVISDIGLPDGSGLQVPAALGNTKHRLPCIALSGFGTEEDIQKSLQAGFSYHLTKPVEMSTLDAAIAELMGLGSGASACEERR